MRTLTEQIVKFKDWIHDDTIADTQIQWYLESAYNTLHTIAPQQLLDMFICDTNTMKPEHDDEGYYVKTSTTSLITYEVDVPVITIRRDTTNLKIYVNSSDNVLVKTCRTIEITDEELHKLPVHIDEAVLFQSISLYYQSTQEFNLAMYFWKKAKETLDYTIFRTNHL